MTWMGRIACKSGLAAHDIGERGIRAWGNDAGRIALIAGLAMVWQFAGTEKVHASPVPDFTCEVADHPLLSADGYLLGQYIYMMGDDAVGLEGYAPPESQLPRVVSGSGMKFSNGRITFHAKGDEGFLLLDDGTQFPCVTAAAMNDGGATMVRFGRSLFGSIIRDGADTSARETDRIPEGEPIEIIRETGSFHDGWQWVEIRYSEGLEGYVWGGTICTDDGGAEITGVHAGCQ